MEILFVALWMVAWVLVVLVANRERRNRIPDAGQPEGGMICEILATFPAADGGKLVTIKISAEGEWSEP